MRKKSVKIIATLLIGLLFAGTLSCFSYAQEYLYNPDTSQIDIPVVPGWNKVYSPWNKGNAYWYYGDENGSLVEGWQKIDGKWYAFLPTADGNHENALWYVGGTGLGYNGAGSMISGVTYALYNMETQEKKDASIWSFKDNGEMVTGWWQGEVWDDDLNQRVKKWYYHDPASGKAVEGWRYIDGKWYYFSKGQYIESGPGRYIGCTMQTGWVYSNGSWYYMNSSGAMQTGWQKINGTWYYLKSSGSMAAGEWCGGYWFSGNGAWTYQPRGSWHKNSTGWWYGDTSGWYAKNQWQMIDGTWYWFNSAGYWAQ